MKRFFGLLLTLAIAFVLVGCGKTTEAPKHEGVGYEVAVANAAPVFWAQFPPGPFGPGGCVPKKAYYKYDPF